MYWTELLTARLRRTLGDDMARVQFLRRQSYGDYLHLLSLADVLLANPPVLILDEPTAGLDPTQIRETRALIKELGQHHTVLLSTPEVPREESRAWRLYRRVGFTDVLRHFHFPGDERPFAVLGRDLPLEI